MLTNVITPESAPPLQSRPATRAEAVHEIMAIATGTAAYRDREDFDDYVEQCARILSVVLWQDVDRSTFRELVDAVIHVQKIRDGGSVVAMFGADEDTPAARGDWLFYHETQINWFVDQIARRFAR